MSCFFGAFLIGFVLSLLWQPLVWLGWPLYALLVLASVFDDTNVLYCPFCRKRVKLNAKACHHCGRTVTPSP
jgi:predicted amidophosphoribosyltransferase